MLLPQTGSSQAKDGCVQTVLRVRAHPRLWENNHVNGGTVRDDARRPPRFKCFHSEVLPGISEMKSRLQHSQDYSGKGLP